MRKYDRQRLTISFSPRSPCLQPRCINEAGDEGTHTLLGIESGIGMGVRCRVLLPLWRNLRLAKGRRELCVDAKWAESCSIPASCKVGLCACVSLWEYI